MSSPETTNILSSDRPLMDPEGDRLGYAPFARQLATSFLKVAAPDGLVAAIYGQWGSGKSTLLNFVCHYLEQAPEDERPIIIPFNPWWFSGQEDLTRCFFGQIQAVVSKRPGMGKQVAETIGRFAEVVSELPATVRWLTDVGPAGKVIKAAAAALKPRDKDVTALKAEISKKLEEYGKRILIFIDDLDRLTAEEIRQIFRLIKAVGDFPNVLYVLAFDTEVVKAALHEVHQISGEAYIEKIVQVPFELPLPDKAALRRLLFEDLDRVLAGTPEGRLDQTYWANVFFDGIDHFITTPRDIVRLVNTLSVTYPAVAGEVNPVDFIAIETLRVFASAAYDLIRKNPDEFVGHSEGRRAGGESLRAFHDRWLEAIVPGDREAIRRMLLRLFPKLQSIWQNTGYGPEWEQEWRREQRVCSPEWLPVYFRLAVPEGALSNTEMLILLAEATDSQALERQLLILAEQRRPDRLSRARAFLERLEDYTQEQISLTAVPPIITALFQVGDILAMADKQQPVLFDIGNEFRVARVVHQLLQRVDEPTRYQILTAALSEGQALAQMVWEVSVLQQEQEKLVQAG